MATTRGTRSTGSDPDCDAGELKTTKLQSVYVVGGNGTLGISLPEIAEFHLDVTADSHVQVEIRENGVFIPTDE
jgi:hypothetical protein